MKEYEMSAPVEKWLRGQGCRVYCEVPVFSRFHDMVAVKDGKYWVIELKRGLTYGLYSQLCRSFGDRNIGMVAIRPRKNNKLIEPMKQLGIYLYHVDIETGEINLVLEGKDQSNNSRPIQYLIRSLEGRPEGGVAGHKMEKNGGPCYPLALAIINYQMEHPGATWNEMFEKIPNQYASFQSMRGAMSKYLVRKFSIFNVRKSAEPSV